MHVVLEYPLLRLYSKINFNIYHTLTQYPLPPPNSILYNHRKQSMTLVTGSDGEGIKRAWGIKSVCYSRILQSKWQCVNYFVVDCRSYHNSLFYFSYSVEDSSDTNSIHKIKFTRPRDGRMFEVQIDLANIVLIIIIILSWLLIKPSVERCTSSPGNRTFLYKSYTTRKLLYLPPKPVADPMTHQLGCG